jgi:hypothetical protein
LRSHVVIQGDRFSDLVASIRLVAQEKADVR